MCVLFTTASCARCKWYNRGTGQIGVDLLAITNRGQVLADVAGGFTIDPPACASFINDVVA